MNLSPEVIAKRRGMNLMHDKERIEIKLLVANDKQRDKILQVLSQTRHIKVIPNVIITTKNEALLPIIRYQGKSYEKEEGVKAFLDRFDKFS